MEHSNDAVTLVTIVAVAHKREGKGFSLSGQLMHLLDCFVNCHETKITK